MMIFEYIFLNIYAIYCLNDVFGLSVAFVDIGILSLKVRNKSMESVEIGEI